jgi:hypothetical protein
VVNQIRELAPSAERIDLTRVDLGPQYREAGLADAALLEVYELNDRELTSLREAGALAFADKSDDAVTDIRDGSGRVVLHAALTSRDHELWGMMPRLIVTPETAARLGLDTVPGLVVLRNITNDELSGIEDLRDEIEPPPIVRVDVNSEPVSRTFTMINTFSPSSAPSPFMLETILSGVALVFALFVVAVSLALAAAETREERDVLAVVGAAPTTMRRTSAQKAVILTVMGALLAIPVGFLPVVVFTRADGRAEPWLVFPWRTVALLVVAVPLITAAVTGAASALALRVRPVHVSTMTFD